MRSVNLIPTRQRHAAAVRRRLRVWALALGCFGAAVACSCFVVRAFGSHQEQELLTDVRRAAGRIEDSDKEYKRLSKEFAEKSRVMESSQTIGEHPDWSKMLGAITQARGQEVVIDDITLTTDEAAPAAGKKSPEPKEGPGKEAASRKRAREAYTLVLKGYGLSYQDVIKFVKALERLKALDKVVITDTKSMPYRGMPATWFEVRCAAAEKAAEEQP